MIHIIIKDLKLFLNDKKGLFLYFMLPIALISIFVIAYSNMGGSYDPIRLIIVNNDKSNQTKDFVSEIDSLKSLRIYKTTEDTARQLVRSGKIAAALFINYDALKKVNDPDNPSFTLLYDRSHDFEYGVLRQLLVPRIKRFTTKTIIKKNLSKAYTKDNENINEIIDATVENQAEFSREKISNLVSYQPVEGKQVSGDLGLIQGVAGTTVLMLLFGVRSIGSQIIEEKENNTFLRTMFSSLSPDSYLFGKFISSLIVALAQITVMFLFAALFFNFRLFLNFPALFIITLLTAISCASFSILIGVLVTSRTQLQSISTIVILTMSAIGGSMVPLFIMPLVMQKLAVASINYWAIQGYFDIYLRGYGIPELLPRLLALASISAACLTVAWIYFRKRNLKPVKQL